MTRKALIEGIKNGIIDGCNSSHEPYSEHLKDVEYDLAPKGATGLETAFLSLLTFIEASKKKTHIQLVVEKMCYKPHKILGLNQPSLQEGLRRNFVVIKPKDNWIYDPEKGKAYLVILRWIIIVLQIK